MILPQCYTFDVTTNNIVVIKYNVGVFQHLMHRELDLTFVYINAATVLIFQCTKYTSSITTVVTIKVQILKEERQCCINLFMKDTAVCISDSELSLMV